VLSGERKLVGEEKRRMVERERESARQLQLRGQDTAGGGPLCESPDY
jgi:hypothetical protein